MPKRIYLLLIVLIPAALFFSFAALIGRADSLEEVSSGKTFDWIILGPLWAAVVFLAVTAIAHNHPKSLHFGLSAALVVWIAVALTANWWEDKKVQIRMEHWKHMHHDGAVTNTMFSFKFVVRQIMHQSSNSFFRQQKYKKKILILLGFF
jgi:hypothetical protein